MAVQAGYERSKRSRSLPSIFSPLIDSTKNGKHILLALFSVIKMIYHTCFYSSPLLTYVVFPVPYFSRNGETIVSPVRPLCSAHKYAFSLRSHVSHHLPDNALRNTYDTYVTCCVCMQPRSQAALRINDIGS